MAAGESLEDAFYRLTGGAAQTPEVDAEVDAVEAVPAVSGGTTAGLAATEPAATGSASPPGAEASGDSPPGAGALSGGATGAPVPSEHAAPAAPDSTDETKKTTGENTS